MGSTTRILLVNISILHCINSSLPGVGRRAELLEEREQGGAVFRGVGAV